MPLLAESEKGTGQTESPPEREVEMWWRNNSKSMSKSELESSTSEGDSPVDEIDMLFFKRVGPLELGVWIWQD